MLDTRPRLTKWAEVDARTLRDNLSTLRGWVGPQVAVMAMVKANGYGHGILTAARAAIEGGAEWLGVSCAEEALRLRDAGIEAPVLLTGWCHPAFSPDLVAAGVDITVFDEATLDDAIRAARSARTTAAVHLKVNSGMNRLGARPEVTRSLCRRIAAAGASLKLRGVFTHFADADGDDAFTGEQEARFRKAVEIVRDVAPEAVAHAANSAAVLRHRDTWHDMVRVGIAFYGYPPVHVPALALHPAMTLVAMVTQVRTVRSGEWVGYGRTWRAQRAARIATVAAGYADGVLRSLSNRGSVLIGGRRVPMVGRVSMDQVSVDVGALDSVGVGDEAVIFGIRDGARLDAADLATVAGTIPNEILCAVSARVPRLDVRRD